MSPIRAVLFDLDRTLVDIESGIRSAIEGHLLALGQPAGPGEYARWKEYEEEFVTRFVAGELGFQEQRRCRARAMARSPEMTDDEADLWFEGFHQRMTAGHRLFEDTAPTLDELALRDDLKIGIVTNMLTVYQLEKLGRVGLEAERFDCVLGLDLLPAAKPDAGAFLAGCAALGARPGETLFVGDEPFTDAVGARDAGLRGIWLDRTGRAEQFEVGELDGIEVIESLAAVVGML